MVDAFNHYRAGFLPVSGGMLDQSAPFTRAVGLLAGMYQMHEEIDLKRG